MHFAEPSRLISSRTPRRLKKEKAKLELVVAELLKEGYGSKEKLEQIKAILES